MAKRKDTVLREQIRERYEARQELSRIVEQRSKHQGSSSVLTEKLQELGAQLVKEQTDLTDQLMEATTQRKKA